MTTPARRRVRASDHDLGPVVIAGGGTAGHVLPGLAVADALVARGLGRDAVRFSGARRGMEATLVPPAGYALTLHDVHGFQRRLSPANVGAAGRLLAATVGEWRAFGRQRPAAVVSVGGYASVPAVLAARLRRVPIVVVSYDAVPGRASLLAARLAAATAVAFPSSPLPRGVVTGAPVRPEVLAIDPDRDRLGARAALGLPAERFTLLVVGGSLGSGALNDVTRAFVAAHRHDTGLSVRHVLGTRNDDGSWVGHDGTDGICYQPVPYEDRMALAYAAADVVLARAGATTVAELAAIGLPSILVPWPLAAEDHQTANARQLADVGGAVLLPEAACTPQRLAAEVERLRADPVALAALAVAARRVGRRDAADAIARLVEECAR